MLLVDAAVFPRDKTCGDGLTPRAVKELAALGLGDWVRSRVMVQSLVFAGAGKEVERFWPRGSFPSYASAVPRTVLDDRLRELAVASGARMLQGEKAVDVESDGDRVLAVVLNTPQGIRRIRCQKLIVADGSRSTVGTALGRVWHRNTPYGVAVRAYMPSEHAERQKMVLHWDAVQNDQGRAELGYGWVFPLGEASGRANIGVGRIAVAPEQRVGGLRSQLVRHAARLRGRFGLFGEPDQFASALLPLGGAVTGVSGRNWMLVGDAAGCVYPLNGEGIDYALETGRLAAAQLGAEDFAELWPNLLRTRFGAEFSLARRMLGVVSDPGRFRAAMGAAFRLPPRLSEATMLRIASNLVSEEDHDLIAWISRKAGALSRRYDREPLFGAHPM